MVTTYIYLENELGYKIEIFIFILKNILKIHYFSLQITYIIRIELINHKNKILNNNLDFHYFSNLYYFLKINTIKNLLYINLFQ